MCNWLSMPTAYLYSVFLPFNPNGFVPLFCKMPFKNLNIFKHSQNIQTRLPGGGFCVFEAGAPSDVHAVHGAGDAIAGGRLVQVQRAGQAVGA